MKYKKTLAFAALAFAAGVTMVTLSNPSPNQANTDTQVAEKTTSARTSNLIKTPKVSAPNAPDNTPHTLQNINSPQSILDRVKKIKEKTQLHESLIKDRETFKRYPPQNARFERPDRDPISMIYNKDERVSESKEERRSLVVWSDKKYYLQEDTAKIYARLRDEFNAPVQAKFAAIVTVNNHQSEEELAFQGPLEDGSYMAQIQFNDKANPLPAGLYKIIIVSDKSTLRDSVAFMLSQPSAEVTGNYRDSVTPAGNLLIEVELDVKESSRIYLRGSLYGIANQAIGSSQYSEDLNPGKQWIPLEYYGLMIKDFGESGPYQLKHLELGKAVFPMQRTPLIEPRYFTDSYALDEFNDIRFDQSQESQNLNLKTER